MILATSRFRVANGMAAAVADAFRQRPHLVDDAPGFLGMEVFTSADDPAVFHLLTRWTDAEAYHAWHGSEAHRLSHQGIPHGLKLEPGSIQILLLERIEEPSEAAFLVSLAADAAPILAKMLADSAAVCWFVAGMDGAIHRCNRALAERLKWPVDTVVGKPIWEFLTEEDAESLRQRVSGKERHYQEKLLVNFVDEDRFPFTLECRLDVQPGYFLLIGEPLLKKDQALQEELFQMNNQLTVLSRENGRKNKQLEQARAELAKAMEDLKNSHWHLKKLQEVLPICMECGMVKSGADWEGVVDYLKKNALFLSHGYCPACMDILKTRWGLTDQGGKP